MYNIKVFDRVGYFLLWTIDPFQTSVFDQTYLLTPRLLQTSYVNALILESRSIIIYNFNLKSSEKFWKFDFFFNFRTSELSQTTPPPPPPPPVRECPKFQNHPLPICRTSFVDGPLLVRFGVSNDTFGRWQAPWSPLQ